MKEKFYITEEGNKRRKVEGNAHEIKLANGETVKVFTHESPDKEGGKYWCVSEVEHGMQIAGRYEYFSMFNYVDYDNSEETLLRIAKEKLDIATRHCSYDEFAESRWQRYLKETTKHD